MMKIASYVKSCLALALVATLALAVNLARADEPQTLKSAAQLVDDLHADLISQLLDRRRFVHARGLAQVDAVNAHRAPQGVSCPWSVGTGIAGGRGFRVHGLHAKWA